MINWGTIATSLILALIMFLSGLVVKYMRSVDKLIFLIESEEHPGLLGRVKKLEIELAEVREWCIRNGYDRRK